MTPFTRTDLITYRALQNINTRTERFAERIYNTAIEVIKHTNAPYYMFDAFANEECVHNRMVEKRLQELFPDFTVDTRLVELSTGPTYIVSVRW
jgi:rubrerythrin